MLLRKFTFMIILFLPLITSCEDKGIEVIPVKDPRTYNWTADTLSYPGFFQTIMYDIWGSSPNDVYAVGHASANDGVMWHYDGNNWHDVVLSESKGGQIPGAFDLTSVFGFNSSDIYAAGERLRTNPNPPPNFIDSSLIIHFDGTAWRKINVYNGRLIGDIYGSSQSDIWAGGWEKALFHCNGSNWETDSIKIEVPDGYFFQVSSISSYNSSMYLIANSNNNNTAETTTYFYKRINNTWTIIDSMANSSNGKFGEKLNQSNLASFYSYGSGGIYKYENGAWAPFFQTIYPIISMWGISNENIFAVGNRGKAYHYNGSDWHQIDVLNDLQTDYYAVWTDGTEAFVAGSIFADGVQKTIVWHGK